MQIIFMRHMESEKNISKIFSSYRDSEELTEHGLNMGRKISSVIHEYIKKNNFKVTYIYCANSKRAITTAGFLASEINVCVKAFDKLRSNNSGALKGKTEEEARMINPLFVKQLELYRAGLFSSYDFVKVYEREDKRSFEKNVASCIENILNDTSEDLKIFVLHHSSLTAAMIYFARKFYNYPSDFYGRVECDLGNIYLLDLNEIILCNKPASELLNL
ncbi:MAG: histidine phosphatase family protein [Lachnospiraceae bacterium]|nr:histidine phosphatase family protein [Lachnospiraceae bacterium]